MKLIAIRGFFATAGMMLVVAGAATAQSGLERAKHHLASGGILAVWSYEESSPFVETLHAAFDVVDVVPVRYVNDLVDEEHTDWLFLARDEQRKAV